MEDQNINTTNQNQVPIPGAILSLVFGIISLVLCWYFWVPVAGIILNIVCLIFAIIAMKKGKQAMLLFENNKGVYKPGTYNIAKIGKILGLVGLILNAIFILLAFIFTIIILSAGGIDRMF